MKLTYIKSESTIKPELIDTESSETTVYLRKDIKETTRIDEMTNNEIVFYEYLEAKLTKLEYLQYLIEKQQADIDYIAIMSNIDLEV